MIFIDGERLETNLLLSILRRNNIILPLVQEIILEKALSNISISTSRVSELLHAFRQENNLLVDSDYFDYLKTKFLTEKLLLENISRAEKVALYREERWGSRANALYLQNKDKYDLITYRSLKCANHDTMQEVYFRLKDGEESWEELARQFTGNPSANARVGPIPCSELSPLVLNNLREYGIGRVVPPVSLGVDYVVLQLENIQSSSYDESTRLKVLSHEFNTWLESETLRISKTIDFDNQ